MSQNIKYHTISEIYNAIKSIEGLYESSPSLSVHKKGESLLFLYVPNDRYNDAINMIKQCNCRITEEIERDDDIVMRICIGRDHNSSIYSNGYQKREGQPNGISATEVFEDMIN